MKTLLALLIGLASATASSQVSVTVSVEGDGALRFVRNGENVYAKRATLISRNGVLSVRTGEAITPTLLVPANATAMEITLDGMVRVRRPNGWSDLGQLVLAQVPTASGETFVTVAKRPSLGMPGEGSFGVIRTARTTSAANANSGEIEIRFRPAANIATAGSLRLGDVAEVLNATPAVREQIEAVTLGTAPLPGAPRTLSPDYLRARLRQALGETLKYREFFPDRMVATRVTHEIDLSNAIEEARQKSIAKSGLTQLSLVGEPNPVRLEVAEADLQISEPVAQGAEVRVNIAVLVDGKARTQRQLIFRAETLPMGREVTIRLKRGGITMEVKGTLTRASIVGSTNVAARPKAGSEELTGTLLRGGVLEVSL